MSNLLIHLKEISKNAVMEAAHRRNPRLLASRAGLNEDEIEALISRDYPRIMTLAGLADSRYATNLTIKLPVS